MVMARGHLVCATPRVLRSVPLHAGGTTMTTGKRPSVATMEKWVERGVARATDGCRVEPDGRCPHGAESWLLVLGMI